MQKRLWSVWVGWFALMGLFSASGDEWIAAVQIRATGPEPEHSSHVYILRGNETTQNRPRPDFERFAHDIVLVRPDGSEIRYLTTDGQNTRPQWSWDGAWIAYTNGVQPFQNFEVVRADGSERKRLLEREQAVVAYWWAHDNRRVLVAVESRRTATRQGRGETLLEGRVIDILTGETDRLTNSDWMRGWNHWVPGEPEVANPASRLLEALDGVQWPLWNPEATHLAFIWDGHLALANAQLVSETGRWFLMQNEPRASRVHTWSWDGRRVLFQYERFLAVAEREGDEWGEAYLATTRPAEQGSLNTDGTQVVFVAVPPGKTNAELYVAHLEEGWERQITHTRLNHADPQWQPAPPAGNRSGE